MDFPFNMNIENLEGRYKLGKSLFNHVAKHHKKYKHMFPNQKLQRMNKSCDGLNIVTKLVHASETRTSGKKLF